MVPILLLQCTINAFFSRILGSAMLWLYELALIWFIFSPTGSSDEEDCLTMEIFFLPSNTCAEFVVPQKFVALTNILNSLD